MTGEGHSKGYGIVGVLEANFIEPAHDKQDFERSTLFSRLESKLKQMQMDYWLVIQSESKIPFLTNKRNSIPFLMTFEHTYRYIPCP